MPKPLKLEKRGARKKVYISFSPELYNKLAQHCIKNDINVSTFVRECVKEKLNKLSKLEVEA